MIYVSQFVFQGQTKKNVTLKHIWDLWLRKTILYSYQHKKLWPWNICLDLNHQSVTLKCFCSLRLRKWKKKHCDLEIYSLSLRKWKKYCDLEIYSLTQRKWKNTLTLKFTASARESVIGWGVYTTITYKYQCYRNISHFRIYLKFSLWKSMLVSLYSFVNLNLFQICFWYQEYVIKKGCMISL